MDPGDPFDTAATRARVLAAWSASPSRFREDANAEEDLALVGYRDRLVVELAQNAADAAARAGVPGRLLLEVVDGADGGGSGALLAANTGAPLDAAGVESLSTLRASAKRDDPAGPVGRFGVGFAAVLAVTDDPAVRSRDGGARWSRAATRAEVAAVPSLADEVTAREGHVPVLRLPWPDPEPPPAPYDTCVLLPLRDPAATETARRQLGLVDAALLLMLPALSEVIVRAGAGVPERVLRADDLSVVRVDADGDLDPALLADRPTEERAATRWWLSWAYPVPPGTDAVLHAPTPTDEPVGLPALLLGSFPLEPSRRHVAAGPLRDHLVREAAAAYTRLVRQVARDRGEHALALVPEPVAAGPLDADLRVSVEAELRETPWLPGGLTPRDALVVDGLPAEAAALLADVVEGLLPDAWARHPGLDRLGLRRLRLADLVDDLAALDRPASWWRSLYDALGTADREALAGLPVPLVGGRVVRGPRGLVLPDPAWSAAEAAERSEALARLGLRVVDPDAVAPLLERLGALPAQPRQLLEDPAVRSAVERPDDDEPAAVAATVLALVRDSGVTPGELAWLAELLLPDDRGDWVPAGELLLPGGRLASLVDASSLGPVDAAWVDSWGEPVLAAVGVLDSFAVVRDDDVALDPDGVDDDHDLDGEAEWLASAAAVVAGDGSGPTGTAGLPPVLPELVAVRDLDLVRDDAWPEALRLLAAEPVLRAAVVDPARAVRPDGGAVAVEPYTAWWLRTHPVLAGRRPDELRAPGTDELAGLLEEASDLGLDRAFLAALGVVTSVADVAGSPAELPLLRAGVDPAGAGPDHDGVRRDVPLVVARVLPEAPTTYREHDDLTVAGVEVDWWLGADGDVHAATVDGLARGLAWSAGRWDLRLLLAAVLAEPARADELLAEQAWDA